METFAQQWSPALSLLVNRKDPREPLADLSNTGGDPRSSLAAMMPRNDVRPPVKGKKTITDDDWGHLVTGQPHPSQVAGEDTAPSGSKKIADEDWSHLVTGEPAASPQAASQPPEIPQSTIPDAIPMPGENIPVHPALAGAYRAAGQHPIAAAAAGASIPIAMSPIGGALTGAVSGIAGRVAPYFGLEEMLSGGKYLGKLWDLVQGAGH